METLTKQDYWVHGHFIGSCESPEVALAEVSRLYATDFEHVRPWTDEDQAELDWQTQEPEA